MKSEELLNPVERGAENPELGAEIGAETSELGGMGPLAGDSIESQRGSDIPREPLRNFVGGIGNGAVSSEGEDHDVVGAAHESSLHLSSGRGSGEEEDEGLFNAKAVNEEEEYGMMCQDPDEQRQLVGYQGISLFVCFPVCLSVTHLRKGAFSCALRLRGWTAFAILDILSLWTNALQSLSLCQLPEITVPRLGLRVGRHACRHMPL